VRGVSLLIVCAFSLLAGCGGDDDEPAATAPAPAAELTVTVYPEGRDGPMRRSRIECQTLGPDAAEPVCGRLAGLTAARLAPVPAETACAQLYGGPAVATVIGTLHGERVDARFDRTDGCEIRRWDRNRALLGRAP
jgi:hypothetical protein